MAYALLLSKTFVASVSGSVFTFTSFGATIPAGTLLDIGCGGNLDCRSGASTNGKLRDCSDNSTQPGIANIYVPVVPNIGGTTAGAFRVRCFTTRPILTGDTITVNMAGGTMSRRSALLTAWTGASPLTQPDQKADQNARVASPITMGPTAALAEASVELAVGMSIWRGGAVLSGVADAGYTLIAGASSGGTTPNTEVNGGYKVNVGTAAETDTHTFTTFSAGAGKIITYRPTSFREFLQVPAFTVLDTFNAGASQNLDGRTGWGVAGRVTAGDFSLKTDAVPTTATVSLGTPASNLWATSFLADQEACATLTAPDTFYLVCRGDTATGALAAGYLGVIGFSGQIDIRTYSGTVLYTDPADTHPRPAAGDSYCLSCIGPTITVWRRASGGIWQALATVQDSTYKNAGFIGVKGEGGTTVTITDFGGGNVTGSGFTQFMSQTVQGVGSRLTTQSDAFTPMRVASVTAPDVIAKGAGIPFVPPPAPFGAAAYFTPPLLASVRFAQMDGIPYIFPRDPYGAKAFQPYQNNTAAPTPSIAAQAGIPYVPPPPPSGARAFLTPPVLPSVLIAQMQGLGPIFPPAPFGAKAFLTPPIADHLYATWAGNRAIFPPAPFGASAFLPPPIADHLYATWAGNRAIFPPAPFGGAAYGEYTPNPPPPVSADPFARMAGLPYQGAVPKGFSLVFITPPLGSRAFASMFGSAFKGLVPVGYSIAFWPSNDGRVFVDPAAGGGGWFITADDFPARFPGGPSVRFPVSSRDFPANRQKGRSK